MRPSVYLALTAFFVGILSTAWALNCYECNVYMSGYGHVCYEEEVRKGRPRPVLEFGRTVEECTVCMKVITKTRQSYYKNTPKVSEVYSRICAKSRNVRYRHGCHDEDVIGGTVRRCFCTEDLCNNSVQRLPQRQLLLGSFVMLLLHRLL